MHGLSLHLFSVEYPCKGRCNMLCGARVCMVSVACNIANSAVVFSIRFSYGFAGSCVKVWDAGVNVTWKICARIFIGAHRCSPRGHMGAQSLVQVSDTFVSMQRTRNSGSCSRLPHGDRC